MSEPATPSSTDEIHGGDDRGNPSGPSGPLARVVVEVEPYHLDRPFDYLIPDDLEHPVVVGSRVEVVFSGRTRRGLVVELPDRTEVPAARLRPLRRVFGPHVWATTEDIELYRWAADRWGATMADVVRHALPARTVAVERRAADLGWFPDGDASHPPVEEPDATGWAVYEQSGATLRSAAEEGAGSFVWRPLADEDVGARLAELAVTTLAGGRDVLVVVPDPGSRLADTFLDEVVAATGWDRGLDGPVVDLRTAGSPRTQYRAWLAARHGKVRVAVGVRGAAFLPLDRPGLVVVVDEANPALKERRSPRHHVRELALERARRADAVGLLVTTVPSAATWRLLTAGRLTAVTAPRRTERAHAPTVTVDAGDGLARTRLGRRAVPAIRSALAGGRYAVVLASRGGEGRALVCRSCRHLLRCPVCGGSIEHTTARHWGCRACGWDAAVTGCPSCRKQEFVPLAAGVEQLGRELEQSLPEATIAVMQGHDQPVPPAPAVLVLTRGSVMDAPPSPEMSEPGGRTPAATVSGGDDLRRPSTVGVIVLPDVDALSRRPGFDAGEDTLRLLLALASWAGEDTQVLLRTDQPLDPIVRAVVGWDPGGWWRDVQDERVALRLPPATTLIAVDVAGDPAPLSDLLATFEPTERMGPVAAPRGRRMLLRTDDHRDALRRLHPLRTRWSEAGMDVRVDVEPVGI